MTGAGRREAIINGIYYEVNIGVRSDPMRSEALRRCLDGDLGIFCNMCPMKESVRCPGGSPVHEYETSLGLGVFLRRHRED